jgi:hypothetical protein
LFSLPGINLTGYRLIVAEHSADVGRLIADLDKRLIEIVNERLARDGVDRAYLFEYLIKHGRLPTPRELTPWLTPEWMNQ